MSRVDDTDGSDTDSSVKRDRKRRLIEPRVQEQKQDSEDEESSETESMDMSDYAIDHRRYLTFKMQQLDERLLMQDEDVAV